MIARAAVTGRGGKEARAGRAGRAAVDERRRQTGFKPRPWDRGEHTRAVGGAVAVASGAAVRQPPQRFEAARQPLVARTRVPISDQADATGVVIPARRI